MTLRINSRHPTADHALDAYFTPSCAVRALMAVEKLPKSLADPASGSGAILDALASAGHFVYGSDLVGYGWKGGGVTVIADYLAEPILMGDVGIITNPPYRLAEAFIRKAIKDKCRFHAWLLRTNFLESVSRFALWRDYPPSRVWISSRRLPMMNRLGWTGPTAPSNQAFAWYVWDAASNDNARLNWFDWREYNNAA